MKRNLTIDFIFIEILLISQIHCIFFISSHAHSCSCLGPQNVQKPMYCCFAEWICWRSVFPPLTRRVWPHPSLGDHGVALLQVSTRGGSRPFWHLPCVLRCVKLHSRALSSTCRTAPLPCPVLLCGSCHAESVWGDVCRVYTLCTFKVTIRNGLPFMVSSTQRAIGKVTWL